MATSLQSQLQTLKSFTHTEPERTKRPFTRPSIIYDAIQAADIDLDTLLSHALPALEALEEIEPRFGNYRSTLFSHVSRELDRELMGIEENKKIDVSISSYLRLLSGHLHLKLALSTLEYLIRRYKIYHYNVDELVLCALPYHDTHTFVRIVQILELGNSKWRFLKGVKDSGAPPPRKVIVQQCLRDMGVLDTLCQYALPSKRYQPSVPVVNFYTAVTIEFLGALPVIDDDIVKRRILPFVFSVLEPTSKGSRDHKAGALMMVSLLSTRVPLKSTLSKALAESTVKVALQDAKESADLPWLRVLLMVLVNVVQTQSFSILSKKLLEMLQEVRDFTGVLLGLSKEFNIKKFISVYVMSLATYSSSELPYHLALVSAIEKFPVKDSINSIVRVLTDCLMLSKKVDNSKLCESGCWTQKVLAAIAKKYPSELQSAVYRFLEDSKGKSNKENSVLEKLNTVLGGTLNLSTDISDSMILLSLEHPKAEIRRATLSSLVGSGVLNPKISDPQILASLQEALLRRLHDEDPSVIQTALSLKFLPDFVGPSNLIGALRDMLLRFINNVTNASLVTSEACDVCTSSLDCALLNFQNQHSYSKEVATMIFPMLLTFPKTWRLNLKALELAKGISWPLYRNVCRSYECLSIAKEKKLETDLSTSVNVKTIGALAEAFSANPGEYMIWLIDCAKSSMPSKILLLLVILHSFVIKKEDPESVLALFRTCFPFLKQEWSDVEVLRDAFSEEEVNSTKLDEDCSRFVGQLHLNMKALHLDLLICIFWRLLNAFIPTSSLNNLADNDEWLGALDTLFIFFAESHSKYVFKEHIRFLVLKCNHSPVLFLSKFYTEEVFSVSVQVESLLAFATICSQTASSHTTTSNAHLQLLLSFPSIFVPLSCDHQDARIAAMKCIEALHTMWHHISVSAGKNGNDSVLQNSLWSPFVGEFLELLIEQKRMILSDRNFLQLFLSAVLGSSCHNIQMPQNIDQRFDERTKEGIFLYILSSTLKLTPFSKLMVLSLLKGKGNAMVHVEAVKTLLLELLGRRNKYHFGVDKSCQPLSKVEIETLCFLLESYAPQSASLVDSIPSDHFIGALQVDSISSVDPAVVQPCVTVLRMLSSSVYRNLKTEIQDKLFEELVFLFRNDNAAIQNAARDAILRVNVSFSTVGRLLDLITAQEGSSVVLSSGRKKKKYLKEQDVDLGNSIFYKWESKISFLGSLLDVLLLKKDMEHRTSLTAPLFKLLSKIFKSEWLLGLVDNDEKWSKASFGVSHTISSTKCYIQQTVLMILEDIVVSLLPDIPQEDDVLSTYDIKLLLECAREAEDTTTRNHVLSLISSIAKIVPEKVFDHIVGIFTVIGESTVKQSDSHSQHVFEDLVSAIVPSWLSEAQSVDNLLQIFIDVLPEVAENRWLTIMVYMLRILGERNSLASLLVLLFRSAVTRRSRSGSDESSLVPESFGSLVNSDWEYKFAIQICTQYSCMIWLPSLVLLLKQVRTCDQSQDQITELLFAVQFILQKLHDTELNFKLESKEDSDTIQRTLGALMEQIVLHLQLVDIRSNVPRVSIVANKELKHGLHSILRTITKKMLPSSFFEGIILLLGHANGIVRKKALKFLYETINNQDLLTPNKGKRKSSQKSSCYRLHLEEKSAVSFVDMCSKIIQLIDASDDGPDVSIKLAAISSLEVLASSFSVNISIFGSCLTSVTGQIGSQSLAVTCSCLRTTATLIGVLDVSVLLPKLPTIMKIMLNRVHDDLRLTKEPKQIHDRSITGSLGLKECLPFSVLVTLEAVIEKLGRFLSPHLADIVGLLVLHPEYFSGSDIKIKVKADVVRRLITEKIEVRYILTPLLEIYHKAVNLTESSVTVAFEMLASLISTANRLSNPKRYLAIVHNHGKIFGKCLLALDLRRTHPESIQNVHLVERSVVHTMLVLTIKLTEKIFKPLFIRTLDWAESEVEGIGSIGSRNLDRLISFYSFVNELAENQRSLFIPYFKYLLDGCTRYLTDGQGTQPDSGSQKRKKAKIGGATEEQKVLSLRQWHLRALIVSSLQKCFTYDTGSTKFLDSSNFQVLLKPVVSQLIAEPPNCLEEFPGVPSVGEVDNLLVSCLGQMAVTAGSDLLWKPLNHEVLMQTRSDKIRSRTLGLRVVKYFVEHLKEEYLVLLPETIPFLGELLEDIELPIKSLAQDILQEMESMSGESLRQYL